jgi:OmpA-OmpF porin, OOP family
MRASFLIPLVVLLSATFGHARADESADDFDDDFGSLPTPAAPASQPAPSAAPAPAPAPPRDDGNALTGDPYPPLDDEPAPSRNERDASRAFAHPTVDGLIGGVHAVDASSAWSGTFRVAMNGRFFRRDGFIRAGDDHRHAGGVLVLNVSPIEHLELAGHLSTYTTANLTTEPDVIQVIGDARLFAKGYTRVLPWLSVGGDLEIALLNGVGDIGVRGAATGVGLRGLGSFDLRALDRPLPILGRVNLRYQFDNSHALVRSIEDNRYRALVNPAPRSDEFRHFVSPSERYALQVNRVDRIGASFGVEIPYSPRERVHVHPLLEWSFALPVNRQDYSCVLTRVRGQESCLASEGFGARPSVLTLGVRAQPYVAGLGLLLAVDIATSGSRTFVREFAPTERYLVHFGVSYSYDPRPRPAPAPRVVRVEVPTPEVRAHVDGVVVDSESGSPIVGAVVHFEGTSLSDLVTDAQGKFRSAELPPGPQGMRIHAEGYREALCVAVLTSSGSDVPARCELSPSVRYGGVEGRVADGSGTPLKGARLLLRGPTELTITAASDGTFRSDKVPEGEYELEVQAENYFPRQTRVRVSAGQKSALAFTLHVRNRTPQVRLAGKRIVLTRQLAFSPDGASLDAKSEPLIAELVDLMRAHPELAHVEIQGHVDPVADAAAAQSLSEQRAHAVRTALIDQGIAPARLEAVGYGAGRPLVPNITAQNRARNRRIEFVIK